MSEAKRQRLGNEAPISLRRIYREFPAALAFLMSKETGILSNYLRYDGAERDLALAVKTKHRQGDLYGISAFNDIDDEEDSDGDYVFRESVHNIVSWTFRTGEHNGYDFALRVGIKLRVTNLQHEFTRVFVQVNVADNNWGIAGTRVYAHVHNFKIDTGVAAHCIDQDLHKPLEESKIIAAVIEAYRQITELKLCPCVIENHTRNIPPLRCGKPIHKNASGVCFECRMEGASVE